MYFCLYQKLRGDYTMYDDHVEFQLYPLPKHAEKRHFRDSSALLAKPYGVEVFSQLSGRRARDEEPLVDAGVDGSRVKVLAARDVEGVGVDAIGRVWDRHVGAG
jgi:hypothetical protein